MAKASGTASAPTKRWVDVWYDQVEVGAAFDTHAHTVTRDDILKFAEVTRDRHPLHTDDAYCRGTEFGGIIAHGLFGLSLMEGLKAETKLYETTSVASLGWDKVRFLRPLFPGDTVHVRVEFLSKRESRKPGRGVVVEGVKLVNQRGADVITAEHATLLKMHPG